MHLSHYGVIQHVVPIQFSCMQIRLVRWTTSHILVLIFAESLVTLSADFRISIRICEDQWLVLEKWELKCLTRDLPVYNTCSM